MSYPHPITGTNKMIDGVFMHIGGMWLALQKYNEIEKFVGPFQISIYEALDNEILNFFDQESLDEVRKLIRERYDRKKGL